MFGSTNTIVNTEYNIIPDYINLSMASDKNCSECEYAEDSNGRIFCNKFKFITNKESVCNFYE